MDRLGFTSGIESTVNEKKQERSNCEQISISWQRIDQSLSMYF